MSRERTRPTREETRQRLFEAAVSVFEQRGIGAASIEAIAAEAGFTRGAFYSNFASKDDLIIALLGEHIEHSVRRNLGLLADHEEPGAFVAALRAAAPSPDDPLGHSPLLHMELILYVARAEQRRPELAERLRARRELIAEIVRTTTKSVHRRDDGPGSGGSPFDDPDWVAAVLLALEDGFRLHQVIDPTGTPPGAFLRAVVGLQHALGIVPRD